MAVAVLIFGAINGQFLPDEPENNRDYDNGTLSEQKDDQAKSNEIFARCQEVMEREGLTTEHCERILDSPISTSSHSTWEECIVDCMYAGQISPSACVAACSAQYGWPTI
eukprot:CAMPEP_0115006212 /NCGR_PEP_ID=MMETSP0216-20121206/20355_1 /TAXON_ID=223996 /ORGANISM="Protocruzia adherens, Strain Boccale" /LENGTH=109 /DNA_ID=CAMNT_0002372731 /DNA_START=47 /DNA_END=376 /DNA_ORIENTATION=+